jgi:hypothetical protein
MGINRGAETAVATWALSRDEPATVTATMAEQPATRKMREEVVERLRVTSMKRR